MRYNMSELRWKCADIIFFESTPMLPQRDQYYKPRCYVFKPLISNFQTYFQRYHRQNGWTQQSVIGSVCCMRNWRFSLCYSIPDSKYTC